MPTRVQKVKQHAERESAPDSTESVPDSKQAEHDKALAEIDALLDDIEGVLEENAASFVEAYVQKGGE